LDLVEAHIDFDCPVAKRIYQGTARMAWVVQRLQREDILAEISDQ